MGRHQSPEAHVLHFDLQWQIGFLQELAVHQVSTTPEPKQGLTLPQPVKTFEPKLLALTAEEKAHSQYAFDGLLRLCNIDSSKSKEVQVSIQPAAESKGYSQSFPSADSL